MRAAISDPFTALSLLPALILLALLGSLAVKPSLVGDAQLTAEPSFSAAMKRESNGETGRGSDIDPDLQDT